MCTLTRRIPLTSTRRVCFPPCRAARAGASLVSLRRLLARWKLDVATWRGVSTESKAGSLCALAASPRHRAGPRHLPGRQQGPARRRGPRPRLPWGNSSPPKLPWGNSSPSGSSATARVLAVWRVLAISPSPRRPTKSPCLGDAADTRSVTSFEAPRDKEQPERQRAGQKALRHCFVFCKLLPEARVTSSRHAPN